MLSIEPVISQESKAAPGVTFKVRSLSRRERAAREFPLIDARARINDLLREWLSIMPPSEGEEDKRTPEQVTRVHVLDMTYTAIMERDIKPAVIRSALVAIEGLEISGAPATPESIFSGGSGVDALIDEIFDACNHASGLTEDQEKNSASPTTSIEPAVGERTSSNSAEAAAA